MTAGSGRCCWMPSRSTRDRRRRCCSCGNDVTGMVGRNLTVSVGGDTSESIGDACSIAVGGNRTVTVGNKCWLGTAKAHIDRRYADPDRGQKLTIQGNHNIVIRNQQGVDGAQADGDVIISGRNGKGEGQAVAARCQRGRAGGWLTASASAAPIDQLIAALDQHLACGVVRTTPRHDRRRPAMHLGRATRVAAARGAAWPSALEQRHIGADSCAGSICASPWITGADVRRRASIRRAVSSAASSHANCFAVSTRSHEAAAQNSQPEARPTEQAPFPGGGPATVATSPLSAIAVQSLGRNSALPRVARDRADVGTRS